ncbi:MAG: outer membrane protein assembly factor BamD [Lentisphaerae bacterium]|jgi:outer membrane protein assembly factor BamD (BamD/ComL family)|nr:outer membrane protein assembly factor BamD [Lentisphaerota bacterium]
MKNVFVKSIKNKSGADVSILLVTLIIFLFIPVASNVYGRSAPSSRPASGHVSEQSWRASERGEADAPVFKEQRFIFGKPSKKNSAAQYAHAQSLEKAGKFKSARKAYNALVHEWGSSKEAADAQIGVAVMLVKERKYPQAFKEYQYFIENYSGVHTGDYLAYESIIESQFEIANVMRGKLEKGGFFSTPSFKIITSMYEKIIDNAPEWKRASECAMYAALCYEDQREYLDAIPAYEALAARYPFSKFKNDALYRAGFCRYEVSKKYARDERTMNNALAALRKATMADPDNPMHNEASARIAEVSQKLAAMNFEKARFYDEIRMNPEAAIVAYTEFIEKFPASKQTETAKKRISQIKAEMRSE